jgi:ABC-type Zn uptake system ZnuABC Zn-binding protein ZnuA
MQTKKLLGSLAASLLLATAAVLPSKAEEMDMDSDAGMKATITEIQGSLVKMVTEDGDFVTMFVSPGSAEYSQLTEGANVMISGSRISIVRGTSSQTSSSYAERLSQKVAAIEQEYQSNQTVQNNSVSSVQTTTTTTTTTTTPTNTTPPPQQPVEVQPVRALW